MQVAPINHTVQKSLLSAASGATLNNLKIGKDAGGTVNDFGEYWRNPYFRQLTSTEEQNCRPFGSQMGSTSFSKLLANISSPQLWLDASDTSSITKNSSNQVSQWNGKSTNGRNVSQSGLIVSNPFFFGFNDIQWLAIFIQHDTIYVQ